MKNIYINLGKVPYDLLHPILKNIYEKISKKYNIIYFNKVNNTSNEEIPKVYNLSGLKKIKLNILRLINKLLPRFNILEDKINGKILTSNNFLYTNNDYYIIATCLYQFSPGNINAFYNFIFKKIFKYFFTKKNLKKIILLSKTAYDEFIVYGIRHLNLKEEYIESKIDYIYPFLVNDNIVDINFIENRILNSKKVIFLFIARNFIGKGGIELISTLENIYSKYKNNLKFSVNIISNIPKKYLDKIKYLKSKGLNINTFGINFTQKELENNFYLKSHALLHLTRADLFGMVGLESKKNGLAVITTNQYLNKELFKENEACILPIDKKYIWNNGLPKLATEYMQTIEKNILNIKYLEDYILKLTKDKEYLNKYSINNLKSLNRFTDNNLEKFFKLLR